MVQLTLDVRGRSGEFRDDIVPEIGLVPKTEGEGRPLSVEHVAPGLFRTEFPIEKYGEFYRLMIVQRQGDEVVDVKSIAVTESYSPEFRSP